MYLAKTLLTGAAALLLSASGHAQIFDKTKGKFVQKLLSQTAHVYTYGGAYNDRIRTAFTNHWTATPVEFHDVSKGYPRLEGSSLVFAPEVIGLTVRDHATSMNHPFYVFGAANQLGIIDGESIVAAFPINGFHYEFDVTSNENMYDRTLLRIPYIVQTMNEMVALIKTGGSEKDFFKAVDARSSRIAGKTMLIPKELIEEWDVNPNTTAMMKAKLEAGKKPMKPIKAAIMEQGDISFSGKYKVLPAAEIMKLEAAPDAEKYTVFLPAIDNKKYVMVYDLKSKELLYFETANMGMRVKSKDFEKLNKAIGQ